MIKKIDSSKCFTADDLGTNGVQITYVPNFSEIKVTTVKVVKAVLKLPITAVADVIYQVYNVNQKTNVDEIIDTFKNPQNVVCVDITDELQCALENSIKSIKLKINNLRKTNIDLSEIQSCINYYYKKQSCLEQASYSIDAGKAGSGNINLVTGVLTFKHQDVKSNAKVLPISVSHIYNSLNAKIDKERVPFLNSYKDLPSYNCGNGWKTNLHQYLVKETIDGATFSDQESSTRYTYVDGAGNYVVFLDKYYYIDNQDKKHYLIPDLIRISQDGKLSYLDEQGITHNVTKEIVSDTGLILTTKFKKMQGVSLLTQDNEDVVTLKDEIKNINKSINEMNWQLEVNTTATELLKMSRNIAELNKESQSLCLDNESADINLQNRTKNSNEEYKRLYKEYIKLVDQRTYYFAGASTDFTNKVVYPSTQERSYKIQCDNISETIDTASNAVIYGDNTNEGVLVKRAKILSIQQELLEKNNQYSTEQLDLELKKIEQQNNSLKQSISDYEELVLKKTHQLEILREQVPEIVLNDANGNIMGFSETADPNVFKLFTIVDVYENQIRIIYDDNKITKVVDGDGNVIEFSYEDDRLMSLKDTRHRMTKFNYDEKNNLIKIVYPSNNYNCYEYDENGCLIGVKNDSGMSYHLLYNNNKVNEIYLKSNVAKIGNDVIEHNSNELSIEKSSVKIDYYDYESTRVTDQKANKTITYVFDALGRVINKYDNVFENNAIVGNVNAVSYERNSDKHSFVIKENTYSKNLLSTIKSDDYSSTIPEFYLGDDLICDEALMPVSLPDNSNEEKVICCYGEKQIITKVLPDELITKIKNEKITDLVLSGWAKADAAWVNRKSTDYCGMCEDEKSENELEQMMLDNMDEHKAQRRFELRAELRYKTNGGENTVEQYCSFDWMNTEWQYCAFPVTISEDLQDKLIGISVCFDYSNNTGTAEFYGMSLKKGEWEYTEYKDKLKYYTETSSSDFVTRYEYDEDKKLIKTIYENKNNHNKYQTVYAYNSNGALVRTIDYNGIVTENVYNDKGTKVKSMTYHIDEPANKFYTEKVFDEKGQKSTELNEFGEKISEDTYIENTGFVASSTDSEGNKTSYGYDVNDDTLLQITTNIDDEINSNTIHYNCNLLTSLIHNDTEVKFEYNGFGEQTKAEIAGKEYCSTKYEDLYEEQVQENSSTKLILIGVKTTTTNANKEQFICYSDLDGNTTKIEFIDKDGNESVLLENRYDTYGNLIFSKDYDADSETGLYYDEFGRLSEKEYDQNGLLVSLKNTYDRYGNVTKTVISIGEAVSTITNNYDNSKPEAKFNSLTINDSMVQSYTYDKLERVSSAKLGSLYIKYFNYLQKGDHTSNLIASEWFGVNGVVQDSLKYQYNAKGNITKVLENGVEIARYEYDAVPRLVREDNKKLNQTITFAYDAGGNIVRKTIYNYTTVDTDLLTGGVVIPYQYPSSGWRDQLQKFGDAKIEYDDLGNPTNYRNNALAWSHGRQLDKFNDIEFKYNASGVRTNKIVNGNKTDFYYEGTKLLAKNDGNLLLFHYGHEGVIGFTYDGVGEYYYKKNIMGDVLAILDSNGQEIVKYAYDAWGNHQTFVLTEDKRYELLSNNNSDTNNAIIANLNPFRYRGYYFDVETKLYYLISRYYDPEIGRFINTDDISYLDKNTLNGLNLFAYCCNNPTNKIDSTGHWWLIDDIIAATVGAIIGTVGQLVSDLITSVIEKEWSFSSWETYVGAAVGGAVGGWTSLYLGPVAGTAIGSGVSTFIGQGLECLTGTNVRSFSEILMNTTISAGIGALTGGLVQYMRIPGITSGSHSFTQVWKSGVTKSLKYGYHMAFKTIIKGFVSEGFQAFSIGWLMNSTILGLIEGLKK